MRFGLVALAILALVAIAGGAHDVRMRGFRERATVEQALERASTSEGNKGFDVTVTALEMAQTMRELGRRLPGDQG